MSNKISIPDIGTDDLVEVIEVNVSVGDKVELEQTLIVLESDKASMEIPSPMCGMVSSVLVKVGDQVKTGQSIFLMETVAADSPEQVSAEDVIEVSSSFASEENHALEELVQSESETVISDVCVPDIGTPDSVEVIEVNVKAGDIIEKDQTLIVLESDKASMEVPAPFAGEVVQIHVQQGQKINQGELIVNVKVLSNTRTDTQLAVSQSQQASAPVESSSSRTHQTKNTEVSNGIPAEIEKLNSTGVIESKPSHLVYAGPAVRLMARELGLDLALISGTGPNNRLLKADLQRYVKSLVADKDKPRSEGDSSLFQMPEIDFSEFGEVKIEALTKLEKLTAANMRRSWLNIPHVTQFENLDITDLESFRKTQKAESEKRQIKLTPLAFIFKALASALIEMPKFNSSLNPDGETLVYKHYVHIGMAVDTEHGLLVPVIRDVDQKSIWQLAQEIAEVAEKARNRKLRPNDMKGGCFTVSSLGRIGGTGFTPIINSPEVAILGVSNMDVKPVWNAESEQFKPHKVLPVALSYDHRVINGGDAGRFLALVKTLVSDLRELALLG